MPELLFRKDLLGFATTSHFKFFFYINLESCQLNSKLLLLDDVHEVLTL